jgi:hypothetical protein
MDACKGIDNPNPDANGQHRSLANDRWSAAFDLLLQEEREGTLTMETK